MLPAMGSGYIFSLQVWLNLSVLCWLFFGGVAIGTDLNLFYLKTG